ncbi:hypothetical protein N7510_009907 [Penicillium lagena]|uniref:uncharacterized protein n=1 Tax=Penicillium lagena TaxID=94218 RepID=UPI0025411490|nr:uncharacterized protein N7510_009907 [Penicillium lagena]KAJ5604753.1 hypothetical protein N7510_009907 [Penicillium lagena]
MANPPDRAQQSTLKTSLPTAYAAANAQQPRPAPPSELTPEEQEKYLLARPGATAQHLDIALQHAHQIQAQKDTENLILDRILDLVTLPTSPSADPATPSPEDARTFKAALIPFRPSDYDNLTLERNYDQLCGYGLCPRRHRKEEGSSAQQGSFKFKWGAKGSGPGGRGRSMDIVPQEKLEKWCSDDCAERALFIRVQLAEEPVWERRAGDKRNRNILLLEEARAKRMQEAAAAATIPTTTGSSSKDMEGKEDVTAELGLGNLTLQDTDHGKDLALERGDTGLVFRNGRVDVQIKEKERELDHPVAAPQLRPEDATGGSIEGYVPSEERGQQPADDDGDVLDQI